MNRSIFISYRRNDTAYASSAIYDRLAAHFGRDQVFLDLEVIPPGVDFAQAITHAIRRSSICLVIIGDKWLSGRDAAGARRMDHPQDFIRLEIETAFAQGIAVIPVLVGNAWMPSPNDLPASLHQLSQLNAVELRTGRDFSGNIERLIQAIEHFLASPERRDSALPRDIRSEPSLQHVIPAKATPTTEHPAGSVFISYRREGGAETARLLRYELLARGWSAFLDVEDLKAGKFDEMLLSEVASTENFLLRKI
jgi:hypothetical protein